MVDAREGDGDGARLGGDDMGRDDGSSLRFFFKGFHTTTVLICFDHDANDKNVLYICSEIGRSSNLA
jgi:hypothetical protein